MKIIKNIMTLCVMIALQAKSASSIDSEEIITHLLRHLVRQDHEVCARIEGLRSFANFVVESNVESNPDCANLTEIDDTLMQNMGFPSSKEWVEKYKSTREEMVQTLRDFRTRCDGFLSKADSVMNPLRKADVYLHNGASQAVFSHPDQGAHQDVMSHWENFREKLEDTHRLVEEHILSIDACKKSVDSMVQGVADFRPGRFFAKFFAKDALKANLKGYRRCVNSIEQEICRVLELLPEHLEQESYFRYCFRCHPLVVLREQCAAQPLSTHYANFQKNLYDFWNKECKLTTRIERLAGCVHFFKQDNIEEYNSVFPKLNREDAKWFGWWGRRLNRLVTEFTDFEGSLQRRIAVYAQQHPIDDPLGSRREPDTQDLCSGSDNEDDSVLPPIQVSDYKSFDTNDLCSHLENFIERLKEIQNLDSYLCSARKVVNRNIYAVFCDPTAKYNLGDRLSDIVQEEQRLIVYSHCVSVNDRSQMIACFLESCSEFLNLLNFYRCLFDRTIGSVDRHSHDQ